MNRQEKKRIINIATSVFLQEEAMKQATPPSRRERRQHERALRKRTLRESPASLYEKHSGPKVVKPSIIVPDLQVEAEGVDLGKQERRSPGGIILIGE